MELPSKPLRLALGIYDRIGELCRPMASLIKDGLSKRQLGILALQEALCDPVRPPDVENDEWGLLTCIVKGSEPTPLWRPGLLLVMSPVVIELMQQWSSQKTPSSQPVGQTEWARSFATLDHHLQLGRTALAVMPRSSAEQRRCLRFLLASSRYPVEAHEFGG